MRRCHTALSGPSGRLNSIPCLFSLRAFPSRGQFSEKRTDVFLLWFLRNWDTARCSGIALSLPAASASSIGSLQPGSTKFDRHRRFPPGLGRERGYRVSSVRRALPRGPSSLALLSVAGTRGQRWRSEDSPCTNGPGRTDRWFYFAKYQRSIRNRSILIKISLPDCTAQKSQERRHCGGLRSQDTLLGILYSQLGGLAATASRPLNHTTFKSRNSLTQDHRRFEKQWFKSHTPLFYSSLFPSAPRSTDRNSEKQVLLH